MKPGRHRLARREEPTRLAAGQDGEAADEHDRGLIVERLAWTPAQRLDANTAFLRFYLSIRPDGPLLDGDG
jgi:hypothetical protein